jgi:hypothetical protein
MKRGSTDDPFAEESKADEDGSSPEPADGSDEASNEPITAIENDSGERSDSERSRSLPFIHARDGVKDGRTQRPVFLRDDVEQGIDDLVARMESELDEDVYKTDVTEASMIVAQEHPELVLELLEAWGYGWD